MNAKELCISKLNEIIEGLITCREKIVNGIQLENEDWLEVALPLDEIANLLVNHEYLE